MNSENKKPRIFIDKKGNWYQDGLKITHRWTYLENNKNLDIDDEGNFFVDEGFGKVYVEVEDSPFVVKMVHKKDGKYFAVLNDETIEELIPNQITICGSNVPYTLVKNKKFKARFTTQAYYEFAKNIIKKEDSYYIETPDGIFKISMEEDLIQ